MRLLLVPIFVSLFSAIGMGQRQIADLKPAHAAALKQFLAKNKDYGFISERVLDSDYLNEMRKAFKNLKPYYNAADHNRDGISDFAVILSRRGKAKDNGEGMAETHRYDHPLAIVIFNGDRNGKFIKAFIEDIEAPLVCFLNTGTLKKKRQLYFGVFETDADIRIFTPAGKGYIIEYPDEP